ncbi:MAG: DEAD/DEAH box helicase [Aliifodinibius sp.]|nr:DEAD/DEAH box helicase [Fodinibius sp.]
MNDKKLKNKNGYHTFEEFGLKENILKGVNKAGFSVPSPIQREAIPIILSGNDMIGQAQTGTGKTAAFGLSAMNNIQHNGDIEILVIAPTRELANQISDELYRLGKFANIQTVAVYGGQSYDRQLERIRRGAQVMVATPGRLLDLLSSGRIKNFNPSTVIIDEADEMLDMGFLEDIEEIFKYLPPKRQTLLFSATIPGPIKRLADKILSNPIFVSVSSNEIISKGIIQQYYVIEEHERDDATIRLIDSLEPQKAILFCRTKSEVDRLSTMLEARGFLAKSLHGDMSQRNREQVIRSFRSGVLHILVATDVAARGLDVLDVTHVFNYHIPFDPDSYVHRIGRTGRAGKKGMAVTLVTPHELRDIQRIQSKVGQIKPEFIPTLRDMNKANINKLIDLLGTQPLDDQASEVLLALENEMEPAEIANKAIALLISQETASGPEKIGLNPKRVDKLLSRGHRFGPSERGSRNRSRSKARSHQQKQSGNAQSSNRRHKSNRFPIRKQKKNQ